MPGTENLTTAMTNRSLRTIRTELDFLTATSALTPAQLSSILAQLPPTTTTTTDLTPTTPLAQPAFGQQPPSHQLAHTSLTEKQTSFYAAPPPSSLVPPPPAYASTPLPAVQAPPLATATALYAYAPADAGDLALQPHDRVLVTEWMNADWAKGRNERSGAEGIFPRSYVSVNVNVNANGNVVDEKQGAMGYGNGNGPVEVGQGGAGGGAGGGKMGEQGKKFGKKMGNAAIFGAGATIGSNIVNSIF